MPQIIASTYEILSKIGSGGGGVVYLARHLRLEMLVVLKADKRKLSASPEALRREVDALKKLNHQYLPKVYDFIEENGIVYTVMDYIEGESLDKPLKRGEIFPQPQVIGMAFQLLTALNYLHSRPPHGILHADIKPANIMLTPQGDLRLIDFNIALALGEKGAVRVGLSRGYASPEHYDSDVSAGPITRGLQKQKEPEKQLFSGGEEEENTELLKDSLTEPQEEETAVNFSAKEQKISQKRESSDECTDTIDGITATEVTEKEDRLTTIEEFPQNINETTEIMPDAVPEYSPKLVQRKISDEETVQETPPSNTAEPKENANPDSRQTAGSSPSSESEHKVLLDVRSDIYSVGATLYHLLTGERPDPKAENVRPIEGHHVSPAVSAILAKAMAPDPAKRYQTAQEMLDAFRNLHDGDVRTVRHKRRFCAAAAACLLLFCAGGFSAFVGMKQMERLQTSYVLAAQSSEALKKGDVSEAVNCALKVLPEKRSLLDPPYTAEAERALSNALGVYQINDGCNDHRTISLESEPMKISLSQDGTVIAVLMEGVLTVYDTNSGAVLAEYSVGTSALADVVFVNPDLLLFAGASEVQCVSISGRKELWRTDEATAIAVSEDGTTAALLNRDDPYARIIRISDGSLLRTVSFGTKHQHTAVNDRFADPGNDLFTLSSDGTWLAVSFSDGSVEVYHCNDETQDLTIYGSSDFTCFNGGFYGNNFAFALSGGSKNSVFMVVDVVSHEQLGTFTGTSAFHTRADSRGIYVSHENVLVRLDPHSGEQTEIAYTEEKEIVGFQVGEDHTVVRTSDGAFSVYNQYAGCEGEFSNEYPCTFAEIAGNFVVTASLDSPVLRVTKVNGHQEKIVFSYDAEFPHTETRQSTSAGTFLLYRYDALRICLANGTIVKEIQIPNAEQVYDQQFRRTENGDYLEVIYNNGLHHHYSAADGSLMKEYTEAAPDESLYEEFTTDNFLIRSPLHGTPTVHDLASGECITELESDAYLAYVTQFGDHIITEYITANGKRYGILLNAECNPVADLPGLCDVLPDGTLLFDDMYGTVRKTRIYSIAELIAHANSISIKEDS